MDLKKSLGIWMNYTSANVIDIQDVNHTPYIIYSEFTPIVKHASLQKSEKGMHEKEERMKKEYFNELIAIIKNYESVLLFGPTKAKQELCNLIQEFPKLNEIQIVVFTTEDMTDNQKMAYVRKHFLLF
jgi:stalled ribosome rescue protein Dom34